MAHMKTLITTVILVFVIGINGAFSQSNWEPQTNITGYISTEFNYFDKLEGYKVNYASALSEAGILMTYQPSSKFTMKSVFVYRPDFNFNQMLNEAFGQYSVAPEFNIKIGRFLLPLSPMNSYYYAPVNTSATLPILITNHEFFPLNSDGISLNGVTGTDFRLKYDIFVGGYRNTTWMKTGAVGFFGDEVIYFSKLNGSMISIDPSYNNTYNVAIGGNVGVAYKNYVDVGVSFFKPKDEILPIGVNLPPGGAYPGSPAMYVIQELETEKIAYGVNFRLQYQNTKLIGEYWSADLKVGGNDVDLEGSFVELSHRFNRITPFIRYEDQVTSDVDYTRFTAGMNYKPSFERAIKLEYLLYQHETSDVHGVVATFIYSF